MGVGAGVKVRVGLKEGRGESEGGLAFGSAAAARTALLQPAALGMSSWAKSFESTDLVPELPTRSR